MSAGDRPKTLQDLLGEASSLQTFENMKKLCALNEFEVPANSGIKYKRKMLKPKDLVALNKLQDKMSDENITPEDRMDFIKQQAMICLEGLTEDAWENTDAALMEIVVGACILISKGFRQV